MIGTAHIIRGNALALPMPDASVDCVITSPPYFGLRSYQDGGEHYAGQIGSEPTPADFVDALIAATREMVRVLKPPGSIWVNLGDKYAGVADGRNNNGYGGGSIADTHANPQIADRASAAGRSFKVSFGGVRTKSLIGIPWRYALRCIDDLGLILRAEVIWAKPNGLPESVTDRVRRSHEQWFHFTKESRYFSAVDEIREEHKYPNDQRYLRQSGGDYEPGASGFINSGLNPLGKLPGSVWTIPTQPLQVPAELGIDHSAAFPMEWPRRIIQGWSPAGVCTACGEGRRPVVETPRAFGNVKPKTHSGAIEARAGAGVSSQMGMSGSALLRWRSENPAVMTGYSCDCPPFGEPAPTVPAVILDPFGGTGTVALMAKALGRTGISVDMSQDYSRLATWRTTDPGQLAAALQVEKPEPINPDQLELFADEVPA